MADKTECVIHQGKYCKPRPDHLERDPWPLNESGRSHKLTSMYVPASESKVVLLTGV